MNRELQGPDVRRIIQAGVALLGSTTPLNMSMEDAKAYLPSEAQRPKRFTHLRIDCTDRVSVANGNITVHMSLKHWRPMFCLGSVSILDGR